MPALRLKKKLQRYDPNQTLIIAPDLREWLPENHLYYFIADIVDDIDLSSIYARYDERRGFPPYEPCKMVKVLVYAYCIGQTSSRQIFRELVENVPFRVLAAGNRPDHLSLPCAARA